MAKTVSVGLDKLYLLHELFSRFPSQKVDESSYKVMGFFRAIKKQLKGFLNTRADLQKSINEALRGDRATLKALSSNLQTEKDETAKKLIQSQIDDLTTRANAKIDPINQKLIDLTEALPSQEVKVTFDNEDFLFVSTVIKENPNAFFGYKTPDDKVAVDFNTMNDIFEIIE